MESIDWKSLPFGYIKTDYNIRCYYKDGKWGELEISSSEFLSVHMAASGLHYGQEAFEGLKAFKGVDGKVRLFRWDENALRMQNSAKGVLMAEVPNEIFYAAVEKAIQLNARFIPPYGSGASLYIRPLLFGSSAQVGVKPAAEYMFVVFVTPVGPYFKEGFKPVRMLIERNHDRAAPMGTGKFKVGGNYAASLSSMQEAHHKGYANVIYLDAREKKYIDESGPANFFGIKDKKYITPDSNTILPSITNMSLMSLAKDMGMTVEKRPVDYNEIFGFEEAGACGTAAVISPIKEIVDEDLNKKAYYGENVGTYTQKLYDTLQAIQYGEIEDKYNWNTVINV